MNYISMHYLVFICCISLYFSECAPTKEESNTKNDSTIIQVIDKDQIEKKIKVSDNNSSKDSSIKIVNDSRNTSSSLNKNVGQSSTTATKYLYHIDHHESNITNETDEKAKNIVHPQIHPTGTPIMVVNITDKDKIAHKINDDSKIIDQPVKNNPPIPPTVTNLDIEEDPIINEGSQDFQKISNSMENVKNEDSYFEQPENIKPINVNHDPVAPIYKLNGSVADNDKSSNFFAYLLTLMVLAIMIYLLFHNKKRIIALVLEGRNGRSSGRGSRRNSRARYHKLDNNLEEAMSNTKGSNTKLNQIY